MRNVQKPGPMHWLDRMQLKHGSARLRRTNLILSQAGCSIVEIVDTDSTQFGDVAFAVPAAPESTAPASTPATGLQPEMLHELWLAAEAEHYSLGPDEFGAVLISVGTKFNFGFPNGIVPTAAQKIVFFRSLHLKELALARSCALGREAAWQRFLSLYRASLTKAGIAIAGSATLGQDLADALYSELFGLRTVDGERVSPLNSYTGRGSLLGWLRTTLAQRHIDHHRHAHRETSLESAIDPLNIPALESETPADANRARLSHAVTRTLQQLAPDDCFLLSAYYLDRQTLLEISRLLRVHEATISRRLKRLTTDLRKQVLHHLQTDGLSARAAEEALGIDPRDVEISVRQLLQSSQTPTFLDKTGAVSAQPEPTASPSTI
jgi:RNA polymerase sigma-70 factor (ECF subfamily)